MGRKHCGKRRNCSFSQSVLKDFSRRQVKNQGLFGKGLNKTKFIISVRISVICKPFECGPVQNLKGEICIESKNINTASFNSLPNDKILDRTKLKAFADMKLNAAKMMISIFYRVETLWEKEKMLVTSIFSFSLNNFQSLLPLGGGWGGCR